MSAEVTAANATDMKTNPAVLDGIVVKRPRPTHHNPQHLCEDKGYDYPECREQALARGYLPHIPHKGTDPSQVPAGEKRHPARRWVVERTHSWQKKRKGGFSMAVVQMKALLEAGVHFGHRTRRWNPKMKPYIFTERNGIHIIDLQQTMPRSTHAYNLCATPSPRRHGAVRRHQAPGAGTHPEAKPMRCGMPYVNQRWLGGTLTNWRTIRQRIDYAACSWKQRRDAGEFERLTKKEALDAASADRPSCRSAPRRHPGHAARCPTCSSWSMSHREDTAVQGSQHR